MEAYSARDLGCIGLCGVTAIGSIFLLSTLSIFLVSALKALSAAITTVVWLLCELFIALVTAFTSGLTITFSIVVSAGVAAMTLPARAIQARVIVSMIVASLAIAAAALSLIYFANVSINMEVAVSIISAAALSVGCAAAWSVGVMTLIEKETQQVGLKMTSLLDAVRHNNHRILRILVKLHAGIRQRDLDLGLLHAVKLGFYECTEILLGNGANANIRDSHENTPLVLACETGNRKLANLLIQYECNVNAINGARGCALHHAAKWGYVECLELLLNHGADPNIQDGQWRTPLILAASHSHRSSEVMRMLITAGSDVNLGGLLNKTALHYAASRDLEIALLLDAEAQVDTRDNDGNTALHCACLEGRSPKTVELLLASGASPTVANYWQRTPLHMAAEKGNLHAIKLLVDAGADATIPDSVGHLPIWLAASEGHAKSVAYFVERNVHMSSYKQAGKRIHLSNPLSVALEKRHLVVAKILVLAGCDCKPLSDWLESQVPEQPMAVHELPLLEWLIDYKSSPVSLQHACRLCIRRCVGTAVVNLDKLITLPKRVLDYLRMADLKDDIDVSLAMIISTRTSSLFD